MEKEVASYQTLDQKYERRKQKVLLYKQSINVMLFVDMLGMSYTILLTMIDWFAQYGWFAIRPAGEGLVPEQDWFYSDRQEQLIQRAIIDKRPKQLKLDLYLWSRSVVAQLIEQQCALKLSERTADKYYKRWGFTPQKPIKQAYEQLSMAVQAFMEEYYLAIVAKAKVEGGEVHWCDETVLSKTDLHGEGYVPAGKKPFSYVLAGNRERLSMHATVTNKDKARWMIIDESFNTDNLIEFLAALIQDTDNIACLILEEFARPTFKARQC